MSVVVEQYNPEWPQHFERIKSTLKLFLSEVDVLSIEHVGSTSVPGLAAKPIIDIDIIVTKENLDDAVSALVRHGEFTYLGELGIVDRHALRDPDQRPPRNIYVCVDGAFQTRNHLSVRDTLRSNPELRDEYGQIKLQLAALDLNIVDYIDAKSSIIQKILTKAGLLATEELAAIHAVNKKGHRQGAIKTNRLVLREFVMKDVAPFHALESIPEVVRYQTFEPRTLEQAKEEVVKIIQNSCVTPRAHFELAVVHEGNFIGRVGALLKRTDEHGEALNLPHANLWFSFIPESHGKGFATEAMRAFIPVLPSPNILEIECDPRNTGSWKMAERLGFKKVSLTEKAYECKGEWVDSLVYQKTVWVSADL
ncbi:acyl-CoA N-acyltransferase [Lindgomyces ingoldianus]|uniref:Acyl-CoA N-acyltransferase n=1 Tax=Lindgomyces ingoldianus TaxID=673940 RepID=A0ACB6R8T1_9PLEO|nr:acyl-CoA N-acyltransferase [Lindgomyces ingoldianus]KAF2475455.1 acyl-CoA N-acyltransferase [Lindgomyces ingoldianus]